MGVENVKKLADLGRSAELSGVSLYFPPSLTSGPVPLPQSTTGILPFPASLIEKIDSPVFSEFSR